MCALCVQGRGDGGKKDILLLSTVPIIPELWSRHKSSSSELLLTPEAQEWNGTLSLLPPHFPSEGTAPFLSAIPHFPHPILAYSLQDLCSGSPQRCFKGDSQKQRSPSALLFLLPGKDAMKEAALNSGLLASMEHKTGRPKNKQRHCNRLLRLFRYSSLI